MLNHNCTELLLTVHSRSLFKSEPPPRVTYVPTAQYILDKNHRQYLTFPPSVAVRKNDTYWWGTLQKTEHDIALHYRDVEYKNIFQIFFGRDIELLEKGK